MGKEIVFRRKKPPVTKSNKDLAGSSSIPIGRRRRAIANRTARRDKTMSGRDSLADTTQGKAFPRLQHQDSRFKQARYMNYSWSPPDPSFFQKKPKKVARADRLQRATHQPWSIVFFFL
ncbi:hypothetical protein CGMCC3_g6185 [Colletotrichum fructicola]|nr:uncharacterized protein CGMCC3_g6185 [Colletotrichum fructicola]KAE9577880.1 hypothetical protein CGMCC3_g6185 [Colletotrichum fructicola]